MPNFFPHKVEFNTTYHKGGNMREAENYRPILAELLQAKEGRMWTQADVALYIGKDRKTVKRRFGIGRHGIEVHELARRLANNGN